MSHHGQTLSGETKLEALSTGTGRLPTFQIGKPGTDRRFGGKQNPRLTFLSQMPENNGFQHQHLKRIHCGGRVYQTGNDEIPLKPENYVASMTMANSTGKLKSQISSHECMLGEEGSILKSKYFKCQHLHSVGIYLFTSLRTAEVSCKGEPACPRGRQFNNSDLHLSN